MKNITNVTNIDNLLDLDSIPSDIYERQDRPAVNPNFLSMIDKENQDRNIPSIKSKIRQTKDWRGPLGGGNFPNNIEQEIEPRAYNIPRIPYHHREERLEDVSMNEYRCINIVEHVANCPICTKYYTNDRSHLYFIILFLFIVCILLLKRLLENNIL